MNKNLIQKFRMNMLGSKLIGVVLVMVHFVAKAPCQQGVLKLIKYNIKPCPGRFIAFVLLGITFSFLGTHRSLAQPSLTIENTGLNESGAPVYSQETILWLKTTFNYSPDGLVSGLAVAPGSFYVGPNGKQYPISSLDQTLNFPPFREDDVYEVSGSCDLGNGIYGDAPGGTGTFYGAGLGVFFNFGGNTNLNFSTNSSASASAIMGIEYPMNGIYQTTVLNGDSSAFDLNTNGGSQAFMCYASYVMEDLPGTSGPTFLGATVNGYVSCNPEGLNTFFFPALLDDAGFNNTYYGPYFGYYVDEYGLSSDAGFDYSFWLGHQSGETSNSWPATVTTSVTSGGNGQTTLGAGGLPPSGVAYPTNSALPIYYYTNLPSGTSCGVPPFGQVDYAYSLQTLDGSLIQTLTLPTNWSGSVTVSVSNNVVGTFQAGETVSLTNFPGGGVGRVCAIGDGSPLYISGIGFPMVLTFNTNQSTLALTALFLQVIFPLADLNINGGSQLIIPLSVQSNLPLSYQWQFNDSDLADQTNAVLTIPDATATNAGAYDLVITTSGNGSVRNWYTPDVYVTLLPTVQFTASPTNGVAALAVQFNSPSIDSGGSTLDAWQWNFEDGTTSTLQNPPHAYTTTGTFSPTLIATNENGTIVIGFGPTIVVTNPIVKFTASPATGIAPLAVQFNCPSVDSGGNALDAWQWNFGDGTTSTLQNPSHTYQTTRTFSPTLIVTNENGNTVIGSGPPIAVTNLLVEFTANPSNGTVPLTVQFNCPGIDSGGNTLDAWQWNFGDGTTSTLQNPSHTYMIVGTFNPTLVATNKNGITVIGFGPAIVVTFSGQTIQPVFYFNGTNGANPLAGLTLGPDDNFYGTTESGGSYNDGTVFRVTTNGIFTTLYSFSAKVIYYYTNSDGANPTAPLTLGPDGSFYSTTWQGGNSDLGTVFRITTNGALTSLVSFANTNGAYPRASLFLGSNGNFYGSSSGQSSDYGTVFEMSPSGVLTTLVSFANTNGAYPAAALTLGPDGDFYSTTSGGGYTSDGTVFQVTTNGVLTTLVSFANTNGANPTAALVLGPDGNFYGTAPFGSGKSNDGTVFKVTTNGVFTTLLSFAETNGDTPSALTLGPDGNFYGTTEGGGIIGDGTVFEMTTNGVLTTLQSFVGANGESPAGPLTLGPDGNFYGTAESGGASGNGEIYCLNLPPKIIQQPASQFASPNAQVTFSIALFGTMPYFFQWLSNNIPIVGATNSSLAISAIAAAENSTYSVIITNAWGSVTSTMASLTIVSPKISGVYRSANGNVTLNFEGMPNATTRIWAATNLAIPNNWIPIFTNATTTTNGTWQFIDTNVCEERYYRFSTP
jgi:uncharacterized repeat protein (TIGR03803 family)